MPLERRLKQALSESIIGVDPASAERDLHVVVQRGRRRRWGRRVAALAAAAAVVVGAVVLVPRALDAIRSIEEPRPAGPEEVEGTPGVITTVVGTGVSDSQGDGGLAVDAAIRYPYDLVVDAEGNLYILENKRVRRVDDAGRITTVAGPPATPGGTALTEAHGLELRGTNALAIDSAGNLYVGGGDGKHFMVNRISPSGDVEKVAGTGQKGFSGDGGPAIEAELGWVYDLDVDGFGNVYIADFDNNRIRLVNTAGVITTIAGTGRPGVSGDGGLATSAQLNAPNGVFVDTAGNVYFTQSRNSVVRRIDPTGVITTIAGTGQAGYSGDGGLATEARVNAPEHVAVDAAGNVYIEDTGNNCIRMIDQNGIITTVVGMRGAGFRGDGGPAIAARLFQPSGMFLTPGGILYIADSGNNRVRRVIL
jgi:trimeric autotransporter adhesin